MASEVVLKADDGASWLVWPRRSVAPEQLWSGAAKTVDALFFIADEKQVGGVSLSAEGAQDGVLGFGDVLIFVGKDVFKPLPHLAGDFGVFGSVVTAEEVESELLHIVKVKRFPLYFPLAKTFLEVFGQLEEGEDSPAALFPILAQRRQAGLIFVFVPK